MRTNYELECLTYEAFVAELEVLPLNFPERTE